MKKILLRAGVISIVSLVVSQVIRFVGNVALTKLLAPDAFGLIGVVNMMMLGINLFSDIGIRYVVIQRKGELTADYLNTVWVIQIVRGIAVWGVATGLALIVLILGHYQVSNGAYADPLLPFLMAATASSALFNGLESTKTITERRAMRLGMVSIIGLVAQLISLLIMFAIARMTASPWALVAGAIVTAIIQFVSSHLFLSGINNKWHFDKSIATEFFKKGRLVLLWSPITFLGANAEIIILGGLVDSTNLGNYMIAYLLVNAVYQASTTLSGNVFFPGLSASVRNGGETVEKNYKRFQLINDALIVTAAGFLVSAGGALVRLIFDSRYADAGNILSCLALGLVGLRYSVIEQLTNAHGHIKFAMGVAFTRLVFLVAGTLAGFSWNGMQGAALGVGLSWFSGWPLLVMYRSKTISWPWLVELAAIGFFATGYVLGFVFEYTTAQFEPSNLMHLIRSLGR